MDRALSLEVAALAKTRYLQKLSESGNSEIQNFFAGKTVLVTGGTGFLGKQLTEKLLRSCRDIKRVYMLIRTNKGKDAKQRIEQQLLETVYDELRKYDPNFGAKITAVAGDTSELGLGLSDTDRNTLMDEVDVIFHVAAIVRFNEPIKKAVLTNARGTRELLHLAVDCRKLCAFVHFSTAYVHCPRPEIEEKFYSSPVPSDLMIEMAETTDEEVLQRITPGLIGDWPNTYTYSKAISEDIVHRLAVELKIPVAVVRPAIVVCSQREPVPGWVDVSNVYGPSGLLLGTGLGVLHSILADLECKTDIVPVDMVNNVAIAAAFDLTKNDVQQPKIYNFTANNKNKLTWGEMYDILDTDLRPLVTPKSVWYCFGTLTANRKLHGLLTFLWHLIPAFIADFGATVTGKKPMFRKIYDKIHKLINVLSYFTLNEWKYNDANTDNLYNKLTETDKELFNFDIGGFKWTEFFHIWSLGLRKYIVKDDLKNTDYGLRKQFLFRIGHYVIVLLYVYVFWNLLLLAHYMLKTVVVGLNKVL